MGQAIRRTERPLPATLCEYGAGTDCHYSAFVIRVWVVETFVFSRMLLRSFDSGGDEALFARCKVRSCGFTRPRPTPGSSPAASAETRRLLRSQSRAFPGCLDKGECSDSSRSCEGSGRPRANLSVAQASHSSDTLSAEEIRMNLRKLTFGTALSLALRAGGRHRRPETSVPSPSQPGCRTTV